MSTLGALAPLRHSAETRRSRHPHTSACGLENTAPFLLLLPWFAGLIVITGVSQAYLARRLA